MDKMIVSLICALVGVVTYIINRRCVEKEMQRSERMDGLVKKSADILSAQNEEMDALLDNIAEMKKAVGITYSEAEEGVCQMVQAIQKESGCDVGLEGSIVLNNYKPDMTLTACVPTIDSEKPLLARACPNCGAPVRGSECDYCGSIFIESKNGLTPIKIGFSDNSSTRELELKPDGLRTERRYNPDTMRWEWVSENPIKAVRTSVPLTKTEWR